MARAVDGDPEQPDLRKATPAAETIPLSEAGPAWGRSAGMLAAAGFLLYWLALPPVGWSALGWLVFLPWTWLVVGMTTAPDRRLLRRLLGIGWLFWMAALYFLPLPHWGLWIAWQLLSVYMAGYFVVFVWIGRLLVHAGSWPPLVALPLAWCVLEWIRHWMLTGFGMFMLGHTQYRVPIAIQSAAIGGDVLVSGLLAMAGTGLAEALRRRWTPAIAALATVGLALAWGGWRLSSPESPGGDRLRLAVIQGSIDTEFPDTAEQAQAILDRQFDQYTSLSNTARLRWPDTDLLVWPEGMFVQPLLTDRDGRPLTAFEPGTSEERSWLGVQQVRWIAAGGRTSGEGELPATALLTGISCLSVPGHEPRNSAILFDRDGRISAVYHKNHRVIFGEYVPLAEQFPVLDFGPNGRSLRAARNAGLFELDGFVLMPEICFETTVPHLVSRHLRELELRGHFPDAIVCLTNDGWFFGTSCLDLHLACGVFRAVEAGLPLVTAANTGFSAHVDRFGRILLAGRRRDTDLLRIELTKTSRDQTPWRLWGSWIWRAAAVALVAGWLGAHPKQ